MNSRRFGHELLDGLSACFFCASLCSFCLRRKSLLQSLSSTSRGFLMFRRERTGSISLTQLITQPSIIIAKRSRNSVASIFLLFYCVIRNILFNRETLCNWILKIFLEWKAESCNPNVLLTMFSKVSDCHRQNENSCHVVATRARCEKNDVKAKTPRNSGWRNSAIKIISRLHHSERCDRSSFCTLRLNVIWCRFTLHLHSRFCLHLFSFRLQLALHTWRAS